MDIVRLRTLTLKSKVGYGKYTDVTVENLIKFKGLGVISWLYYNVEWITFTDDILDMLIKHDCERIEKPGTNPKIHERRIVKIHNCCYDDKRKYALYRSHMAHKRRRLEKTEAAANMSKGKLQALNHGHYRK